MKGNRASLFRRAVWCLLTLGLLFTVAHAAELDRRTLELKMGGSELIQTTHPFKRVSIANAEIADVVVLSPKEIYVYGKKVGYTSVILWAEGAGKTLLDVVVALDLTALKEKIHELYPPPKENINVYASETGVVLSGTVSGPEVVEQVLRLTQRFLPVEAEGSSNNQGTGRSGSGITNLLKVGGIQQVMLEVKFAEVSRSWSRDWQAALGLENQGADLNAAAGVGALGVSNSGDLAGLKTESIFLNFTGNAANIFAKANNLTAALELLESEGLARTLAEPKLVSQSGQEASFLAGGEFPIPVSQDEDTVTIQFREFGVGLRFTPIVMADGKISLRVAPSVTDIASTSQIPAGIGDANFSVPSLTTRKLETTVQLYDGQTLALGGLLQENLKEQVTKIPGLGDIPILGALFRSSGYIQNKTDLLVAVTPHIVKPNPEGTLTFPGEYLQSPNWFEFYLEGRLEGRRYPSDPSALQNHSFTPAYHESRGGLEGEYGQQTAEQN